MADPPYFTLAPFSWRGLVQWLARCGVCGADMPASTEALAISEGRVHLRQYHPTDPPADPRPGPPKGTTS